MIRVKDDELKFLSKYRDSYDIEPSHYKELDDYLEIIDVIMYLTLNKNGERTATTRKIIKIYDDILYRNESDVLE